MRALSSKYSGTFVWLKTFFFAPLDPYYTTILRVILSIAVLVTFWETSIPLSFIKDASWLSKLYADLFFTKPYILIVTVILVSFYIGIKPRVSGFLLAFMLLPLVFEEGYQKGRQVIFLSILAFSLLPSCCQFNLINLKDIRELSPAPIWPVRLIQIQLSLLYFVNAAAKTTESYLSGEVLKGLSVMMSNFLINLRSGYLEIGSFHIPLYIIAVFTEFTEYALAFGFWFRRTRVPTAILGLAFHMSLTHVVTIGKLDWASLFLYPAFLLPMAWKDRS